jgi:hypothetical protein
MFDRVRIPKLMLTVAENADSRQDGTDTRATFYIDLCGEKELTTKARRHKEFESSLCLRALVVKL